MKKYYIEPELQVVICQVNSMLMVSQLVPSDEPQSIIVTEEEFESEFSSREFDW